MLSTKPRQLIDDLAKIEELIENQTRFNEDGGIEPSREPILDNRDGRRPTYVQDWHAYNQSQQVEKRMFLLLLADVCSRVQQPAYTFGRPELPHADKIYGMVFKTYSTVSGRRFTSDMVAAKEKGYVSEQPHYNSLFRYFGDERLTPILSQLVTLTSLPLRHIEHDFAVDSTGFGTGQFMRWFSFKHGKEQTKRGWVKCHAITGVKTNVITSVKISTAFENDSPHFKGLVEETSKHFNMADVTADKAYLSRDNLELVAEIGATAWIPMRENSRPDTQGMLWRRLYYLFHNQGPYFGEHYHKRSNVEATFSMIKRKFGDHVRSKTWNAQVNEVLCKIIAHNIVVTVHEMNERNIAPISSFEGGLGNST